MFSNPKFGWVSVHLGEFQGPASYITDVAFDSMEAMIYALEENKDFIVSFDAEGWEFKVISDDYRTFIIEEKNEVKLYIYEKNKLELAKELIEDISRDKEDWLKWQYSEEEKESYTSYKIAFCHHLRKLKNEYKIKNPD